MIITVNNDEIVIRTRDFNLAPDVKHYVQSLSKNGTLERLKGRHLNTDIIKNTPLGSLCDIFIEKNRKNTRT